MLPFAVPRVPCALRHVFVAAMVLSGCATNDTSTDDGPLVQVADANAAGYDVAVLAHAPELTRGNHSLQYIVTNASDATPVDGLALSIVPWMPAMGHGTAITPTITELGDGVYQIDDVDLFMAGSWELRTTMPSAYVAPSLQVQ
jgi:hypothetical protein